MKSSIIEKAQKATIKAEVTEQLIQYIESAISAEECELKYYEERPEFDYVKEQISKIKLKISMLEEIAELILK